MTRGNRFHETAGWGFTVRLIMRVLLLVLLLGLGGVLVWQNPLPLTLTVLGAKTPLIPLGILLLSAVGLGLFAGGLLLFLLEGDRLLPTVARPLKTAASSKVRRPQSKTSKSKPKKGRSSAFQQSAASDWSEPIVQDWSGPAARMRTTEYVSRPPREEWDEPPAPSDRVVDADYRVLRPPSVPPRDPEWDDEFFDDP
jgi:uncharacterized integral membrane protein